MFCRMCSAVSFFLFGNGFLFLSLRKLYLVLFSSTNNVDIMVEFYL